MTINKHHSVPVFDSKTNIQNLENLNLRKCKKPKQINDEKSESSERVNFSFSHYAASKNSKPDHSPIEPFTELKSIFSDYLGPEQEEKKIDSSIFALNLNEEEEEV